MSLNQTLAAGKHEQMSLKQNFQNGEYKKGLVNLSHLAQCKSILLEKSYKCNACDKSCSQSSDLIQHQNSHQSEISEL